MIWLIALITLTVAVYGTILHDSNQAREDRARRARGEGEDL